MSEEQNEAPAKADPDPGDPDAVVVPDESSVNENEVGVPDPTEAPPETGETGESAMEAPSESDVEDSAATSDEPVAESVEERDGGYRESVAEPDLPDRVTASTDPVTGKTVYTVQCDCGGKWPTTLGTDRSKCPRCNKIHDLT